ncbi:acyl-CoA synthetase [Algoriphagus pacificus]|uniref:Acyl-CoA synthetase n=1 Tax=Algoriphagus pacificus TaxID=2811234 RepID=A0ABS3CHB6_9BACT|nr:acyl-CoA synthetase [Algoriphagus pacificus]MBN7816484.1 acyl-CoA synthetase [Algoriphagus pacificus]
MLQLFEKAKQTPSKTAIVEGTNHYSYQELLIKSEQVSSFLLAESNDLNQERVAFMVAPGFDYVAVQWGIWRAGGIAVPLCITYPFPSLQYVIEDTQAKYLIVGKEYESILQPYQNHSEIKFISLEEFQNSNPKALPEIAKDRGAMILYTSGTTSLPKGVLTTHTNLESQIRTLVKAWEWTSEDYILELLPLHHVHGIINVLCCALWSGGTVEFLNPFDAKKVFEIFEEGKLNVFMAVPTIYFKLISEFESYIPERQAELKKSMESFRLMISGSAALPVSVMEKWKEISGHYLLERYGMTEIGMAVSNPYDGERRAGHIGQPLPGVELGLLDEDGKKVNAGEPGEIHIKGPSVFKEYWGKPEATQKSFTDDGWFKTGDIAVLDDGYYRILGRDSIDIIKSGGYKISALEIEEVLRKHPSIKDCGVIGIPNEEWGELVVAALVTSEKIDTEQLSGWMRERMPAYKTPRRYLIIDDLPRNAMGKVTKNELKKLF